MDLYLVQHGEAKPESEDPARPLTDRGRREVERVARAAARAGLRVARILHSGKLRARETAEILAAGLSPPDGMTELAGLAPMDDPAIARRAVGELTEPALLVGHLPQLGRFASLLVVGDAEREIVAFRTAGIVCLGSDDDCWRVKWMLTPELVP
ncbi:MAG TPA: phosphohistidine phosphatase SixA [Gemmatimonadales bacterium]|nr:phosphohistidine phosphatase SixA [Gemmatimonadales bacterium]